MDEKKWTALTVVRELEERFGWKLTEVVDGVVTLWAELEWARHELRLTMKSLDALKPSREGGRPPAPWEDPAD